MVTAELDSYVATIVTIVEAQRHDCHETARQVRRLTREALSRDSFRLACVERMVASIEQSDGPWRNAPLYTAHPPSLVMRVFYWPPGQSNRPHLHGAWTVTGVLYNEIVVETFADPDPVRAALQGPSQRIVARAGETGYLIPPRVHSLSNQSGTDSATLHVFSLEGEADAGAGEGLLKNPSAPVAATRIDARRHALRTMSGMLMGIRGESAADLLERIFAIGDPTVKLQAVKALLAHDVSRAYARSRELEAILRGRDREVLSRINADLAQT